MSVLPQLERDLADVARRRLPARGSATGRNRYTPTRLVAALSVAVALVVGVTAIGSLPHERPAPRLGLRAGSPGYRAVSDLIGGLPQSGRRLGSPAAPVSVTLYGDLECQQCRRFVFSTGFARLVNADVRTGRAQVVYRSLCTSTCDHASMGVFDTQQAAAYAAGRQGLFWQYALLFYREQGHDTGYVTPHYLAGLAGQVVGLNVGRWERGSRSRAVLDEVRAEEAAARRARVVGSAPLGFRGPRAAVTLAPGPSYTVLAKAVRAARLGCPKRWRTLGFERCRDFV